MIVLMHEKLAAVSSRRCARKSLYLSVGGSAVVENAVAQRWNSGPREGHINRLKVKMQMCGEGLVSNYFDRGLCHGLLKQAAP